MSIRFGVSFRNASPCGLGYVRGPQEIFCTVYLEHDVTPVVAIDWIRDMCMNPMAPFVSDDN